MRGRLKGEVLLSLLVVLLEVSHGGRGREHGTGDGGVLIGVGVDSSLGAETYKGKGI